jgi:tRNA-2-methylthio-N6-dimethylallyladenosine synthase
MDRPRYRIRTYGCQMNERDSEIMAGQLEQLGYRPAEDDRDADLIIVNTCAVRGTAENHAFGYIGQLRALKEERPGLRIAVAGCMAQEPGTVAWLKRYASHVDLVFGPHNLHTLPELLERVEASQEMVVDVWESAGEVVENLPSRRNEGARAFVNIIYGCDKFCTFCIVPFTRGRERSRRPEHVLAEVAALADQGYQDVTLLGQNVNSYGHDLDPPCDLATLLREAARVEGIRWLRFLTSHPRDFTDRLIEAIAATPKVARHIHLPVQSGSSAVLRKMNRKYTREQYLDLVARIRAAVPDVVLTTDIIVGFPGETEEDFLATLDLVETVQFDAAFTFLYSPRAGTPAARWEARNPVPDPVKKDRLNRLMDRQYRISLEKNRAAVGREELVLVEGVSKKDPAVLACRNEGGKVVLIANDRADLVGRFVPVRITGARTFFLTGERLGDPVSPPLPRRPEPVPVTVRVS